MVSANLPPAWIPATWAVLDTVDAFEASTWKVQTSQQGQPWISSQPPSSAATLIWQWKEKHEIGLAALYSLYRPMYFWPLAHDQQVLSALDYSEQAKRDET
jgi:hypothetical protein